MQENNITLHMNIKAVKERISDVMAIYLVRPSKENFQYINKDLSKNIFDNYYINFIEKESDAVFNDFFSELLRNENHDRIYKISTHPIYFSLIHNQVFTFDFNSPFAFLNSTASNDDTNDYFTRIGKGLFNILYTLKILPTLIYRKGFPADIIIESIQSNFNDAFDKFPEIKDEFLKKSTTCLIIGDRTSDIPIMLHHAASLGSMYNDIFGLTRDSKKKSSQDMFELDPPFDYIWREKIAADFPSVLKKITEDLVQIADQTSFLDESNKEQIREENFNDINQKISSTLDNIREMTIKRKVLENHANFGKKLSDDVNLRQLDKFYDFEYKFLSKKQVNSELAKKLNDIVSINSKSPERFSFDIQRLLLIYILTSSNISDSEDLLQSLKKRGVDISIVERVINERSEDFSLKKKDKNESQGGLFSFLKKGGKAMMNKIFTGDDQISLLSVAVSEIVSGKDKDNQFTKYSLFKKKIDNSQNSEYDQAIVFVYGGGSLGEFEYMKYSLDQKEKHVIS